MKKAFPFYAKIGAVIIIGQLLFSCTPKKGMDINTLSLFFWVRGSENVKIADKSFRLLTLTNKFLNDGSKKDTNTFCENGDIKFVLYDDDSNKVVYCNEINCYQNYKANFFQTFNLKNELYIKAIFSACGSGINGKFVKFEVAGDSVKIDDLFPTNELQRVYFSKSTRDIFILQYKWDFSDGESHFSDHRIEIVRYCADIKRNAYLGTTSRKYNVDNYGYSLLDSISAKEPELLQNSGISKADVLTGE